MLQYLFNGSDNFSKRIKKRHKEFWGQPDAEKIRNIIMNCNDPLEQWKDVKNWQRKLSNKYNSREFAKMHNCKVPGLYWKGRNINQVDVKSLPDQYVIRPTIGHSCNLVFLMNNGINLFDQKPHSWNDIKIILHDALNNNPHLEFLVEEFIRDENSQYAVPDDFKVYSFNGEVACIGVINRISYKKGFQSFYNTDWVMLKNVNSIFADAPYQPPPVCLPEIIEQAITLSKTYELFVRIDFYATDKGAVFGEFTPTPGLGNGFTPFANKLLTSYWDKYCNGKV